MKRPVAVALTFVMLGASACTEPEVVRSAEGVLTLLDEYPRTVKATGVGGTLVARAGCLTFQQANGAVFQPVFWEGVTYANLTRQFGSLSRPQPVFISGFDVGGSLPRAIDESAITKRCPGAPFILGSIDRPERSGPAVPPNE